MNAFAAPGRFPHASVSYRRAGGLCLYLVGAGGILLGSLGSLDAAESGKTAAKDGLMEKALSGEAQQKKVAAFLREFPRAFAMTDPVRVKNGHRIRFARAVASMAMRFNLPPDELYDGLQKQAQEATQKYKEGSQPPIEIARLLFLAEKYAFCMDASLKTGDAAHRAQPRSTAAVVASLELAAYAALELQQFEAARQYLTVSLGETGPRTDLDTWTRIQTGIALCARRQGDSQAQLKILRLVHEEHRLALGPNHKETLRYHNELAAALYDARQDAQAEKEYQSVLLRLEEAPDPDQDAILSVKKNLATVLEALNRLSEAETLRKEVLRHCETTLTKIHPDSQVAACKLAMNYYLGKRYDEAQKILAGLLHVDSLAAGDDHKSTMLARHMLVDVLDRMGHYAEALTQLQILYEQRQRINGETHEDTLRAASEMARFHGILGDHKSAEPLEAKVLAGRLKHLHPDHEQVVSSRLALALIQSRLKKDLEARKQALEAVRSCEKTLAAEHSLHLYARNVLATVSESEVAVEQMLGEFQNTYDILVKRMGPDHLGTLETLFNVGIYTSRLKRHTEAEKIFRQVYAGRQRAMGSLHPGTFEARGAIGVNLIDQNRNAEAEAWLKETVGLLQAQVEETDKMLLLNRFRLAAAIARQDRLDESLEVLDAVAEILQKENPPSPLLTDVDNLRTNVKRIQEQKLARGNTFLATPGGILFPSVLSGAPQTGSLPFANIQTGAQTISAPVGFSPSAPAPEGAPSAASPPPPSSKTAP